MRVTKIIREYVEDRVNKVYEPRIRALHDPIISEQTAIKQQLDILLEEVNKRAEEILNAHPDFSFSYNFSDTKFISCCSSLRYIGNRDKNSQEKFLAEERDNKIQEILVTLEMGATKEDLDEMLRNL